MAYAFDARPLDGTLSKAGLGRSFEYIRTCYTQPVRSNVPYATRLVNSDVAGPLVGIRYGTM